MKKKTTLLKSLLVAAMLVGASNAWAEDWSNVWTADFSAAPSGMTYSVTNGSTNIDNGYLYYYQGGGSGNRALNTAFTDAAFNVSTNWKMEFDWSCVASNANPNSAVFATNVGTAFTISWAANGTTVTITDQSDVECTSTLPHQGAYSSKNVIFANMENPSHFVITGVKDDGIYLTVTKSATTYVDNVKVSSTFGYPSTFNGSLGRAHSSMALDNITFATPKIAGYVAPPTGTITAAAGTGRKFTLSCITEGTTIYYAESDLEIGAAGWTTYSTEVTTSAATIYAYASDGVYNSEKINFATGAGTEITLNAPTVNLSDMIANGSYYNARLDAWYNTAGVEFTPDATLKATFTPEGGSASDVVLPYTVTQKGTLTITSSADGYVSADTEISIAALYEQTWQSLDFSSLIGTEAVQAALDTDWTQQDGHGRWASWANQEYNFYQHGSAGTANITVNDKLRMREVVLLVEGRGLGRNITGGESISVLSSTGDIVGFEMYNGYGADINKGVNTYKSYGMNLDGNPSVNTNNGALLVQAKIYSAVSTATIGTAGWATFYTDKAVDFSSVDGLTAYTATTDGSVVTLTEVDNVPAATGVVLKGDAKTYTIPAIESSTTDKGSLEASATDITDIAAYNYYVLAINGEDKAQFSLVTSGTIAAGKCYLKIAAGARSLDVVFADETTGIQDNSREIITNNRYYDLQGRRVAQPQKGLYIVNGKKVVLK